MLKKMLLATALSAAFASPTALANTSQIKHEMAEIKHEMADFICSMRSIGDSITALALYNGVSEKEAAIVQANYINTLNETIQKNSVTGVLQTGVLQNAPQVVKAILVPPKTIKATIDKAKAAGWSKEQIAEIVKKNSHETCADMLNKVISEHRK